MSAYCGFRQGKLFNQLEKLVLETEIKIMLTLHVFTSYLIRIASSNRRTPKFPSLLHVMLETALNADSDAGIICSAGGAYRGQTF